MGWIGDYGRVSERVMEWSNEEEWLEVIRHKPTYARQAKVIKKLAKQKLL